MNTFLIIMGVALWVGFNALKKKAQVDADSEEPSVSYQNATKSAFESSLFDQHIEVPSDDTPFVEGTRVEFNFQDADNAAQPFQAEEFVSSTPVAPSVASTLSQNQPVLNSVEFDLRQAIIYQTILSNKYLDEIPSSEIN